ncbi:SOS response-associated peptidase family protein [Enterobacter asburiae]|uniref:SOS response-associated peptidase family protein n=1 Tax=Scandinavium sp. UTDF21-P1B TaxID=3446379 RepID=UPI0034823790
MHRKDRNPLLLAAIRRRPFGNDNNQEGFLIVTVAADEGLLDIHDRRPVVFIPSAARPWLTESVTGRRWWILSVIAVLLQTTSFGTPSVALSVIRKIRDQNSSCHFLSDPGFTSIHTQGYAPFLWITTTLLCRSRAGPQRALHSTA